MDGPNTSKSYDMFGCSFPFLQQWLQSKFKKGMSWDNYGSVWSVDHIIPLSKFNLSNPDDYKQANHYSNLQPLFKRDNIIKSNKLPQNHTPELLLKIPA